MTDFQLASANVSQILQRINDVSASNQPTYTEAGRTVNKGEYLQILMDAATKALELRANVGAPWAIAGRG